MATDTPPALKLAARLDTDAATPLHAALLEKRGAPLTIDASSVNRLGALCVSVLAAAARSWSDDGQALTLADPSEGFQTGCARLGIALDSLSTEAPA